MISCCLLLLLFPSTCDVSCYHGYYWLRVKLGLQRPFASTFWVLYHVDDCGWQKDGLGRSSSRSKAIWASYYTEIHIVNIQWSTCFLEIGLLLYMKCKWTPLSVTENGINLDAWSLISSPHCSVSIIMQTLENIGVFFLHYLPLELLLILGKQLQIQRKDRNSVSQICKIHFLFLIWKNGE